MLKLKINQELFEILRCPVCNNAIEIDSQSSNIKCINHGCGTEFPVINGIPCLINEQNSVFTFEDFIHQRDLFFNISEKRTFIRRIRQLIPDINNNVKSKVNYRQFINKIFVQTPSPRILVLGGSILGEGISEIISIPGVTFIETDVSFGPRTMIICDSHDIPFADASFDGVIVQAVLEHVVDPYRSVSEIYRVLNPEGWVYAETPFIQQIHGREYDFTRFTFLGHRRLFRHFKEEDSGLVCGPGMALAWSYKYFLLSFFTSKVLRRLANLFSDITAFPLKYFDYVLKDKKSALDAASGYYFMGRKSETVLSDRELIRGYRGGF